MKHSSKATEASKKGAATKMKGFRLKKKSAKKKKKKLDEEERFYRLGHYQDVPNVQWQSEVLYRKRLRRALIVTLPPYALCVVASLYTGVFAALKEPKLTPLILSLIPGAGGISSGVYFLHGLSERLGHYRKNSYFFWMLTGISNLALGTMHLVGCIMIIHAAVKRKKLSQRITQRENRFVKSWHITPWFHPRASGIGLSGAF